MDALLSYMRHNFYQVVGDELHPAADTEIDNIFDSIIKLHSALDRSETSLSLLMQRFEMCRDLASQSVEVPLSVMGALYFQGILSDPTFAVTVKGQYSDITLKELVEFLLIKSGADGSVIDKILSTISPPQQFGFADEQAALLHDINYSHYCGTRQDYYYYAVGTAKSHIGRDMGAKDYLIARRAHLDAKLQQNFLFATGIINDGLEIKARENMRWESQALPEIVTTASNINRAPDIYKIQARLK